MVVIVREGPPKIPSSFRFRNVICPDIYIYTVYIIAIVEMM